MAPPPGPKMIVVVYPHTSNWDFIIGLLGRFACGWPFRWIGKHTLFRAPFGGLFRRLGGIPIDRARPGAFIDDTAAYCAAAEHALIVIAPEGTRGYVPGWKSGFYRIARTAGVPIALGYIDWSRRCLGIRGYLETTGDIAADLQAIASHYSAAMARDPAKAGRIALR